MIKPAQALPLTPFTLEILHCQWVTLSSWLHPFGDPFWRLYWAASEGFSVRVDDVEYPLNPSEIMLIPAHTTGRTFHSRPGEQFYIHFTTESLVNAFKPGVYSMPLNEQFRELLSDLRSSGDGLRNTLKLKQLCYACLDALPESSRDQARYPAKITAAMEVMAKNIARPLSNPVIAKTIGMNVSAFVRLFHAEAAVSPQKWYLERRINKAALMLSHSSDSIEKIADAAGFYDRAHFSKVFRSLKKMGPAEYRKTIALHD